MPSGNYFSITIPMPLLKSMMSSSDAWVELAYSQRNVDKIDVVCRINTTWADRGKVEVAS